MVIAAKEMHFRLFKKAWGQFGATRVRRPDQGFRCAYEVAA